MPLRFKRECSFEDASYRKKRRTALLAFAALTVLAALAWLAPSQKPNAVFGRLDYLQFWGALLLTASALSLALVVWAPPRRQRRVAFCLGAVWLGMALALGSAELTAWLLPLRQPLDNPWYVTAGGGFAKADALPFGRPAHLKWSGRSRGDLAMLNGDSDPNGRLVTFATDRDGFRNAEDIDQAEVITIGDSFTEAGNVPEEESFASLVGDKLGKSIRNLGRAGYSSPSELIVLQKFGLECRPSLVIWQIAEANDLAEAFTHEKWLARGCPSYHLASADPTRTRAWQRRSPTFQLFSALRESEPHPWPFSGVFQDSEMNDHRMRFLFSSGITRAPFHHPGWPAFTNALATGARLCRSNRIHLLVLFIPDKARVYADCTDFPPKLAAKVSALAGLQAEPSFGQLVASFCASQRIPFVDATGPLKKSAGMGRIVYQPFDTHLSRPGHKVIADLIVQKVTQLNWK